MGRNSLSATLTVAFVLFSQTLAHAQRADEAIRHAHSLLDDACRLHSLVEAAGADAFTIRSACRLESTVEEVIEKLSCPSDIGQVGLLVDDCILWYNRTSVGVRRDCRLAQERAVTSLLACAGRNLTLLEDSVACLLSHGGHGGHRQPINPQQPEWFSPPTGIVQPSLPGAWVNGPVGVPQGSRSPGYPFGIEGLGQPDIRQSNFGQAGRIQPFPSSQQSFPNPRGQIARAVLELMLSEMSR